jgi:hypothetical protein
VRKLEIYNNPLLALVNQPDDQDFRNSSPFFTVNVARHDLLEDECRLVAYAGLQAAPEVRSRGKLNQEGEKYNRFTNEVSRGAI